MPAAFATSKIPLLAVTETDNGTLTGSMAYASLDIKPGEGRVFIDSFPLTKLDTQISTRFAKEIACSYLDIDCSKKDFFYVIRASSSIVGGPSAGGALAILTIAELQGLPIPQNVAMTGTINSGFLIGPVGGLKEKITIAGKSNMTRVIIPATTKIQKTEDNKTLDLVEYGNNLSMSIIEAANLDEATAQFFGKQLRNKTYNFTLEESYVNVMKDLAKELCNYSDTLLVNLLDYTLRQSKPFTNESRILEYNAFELRDKAVEPAKSGKYYASASYCYGANVKYRQAFNLQLNYTKEEIQDLREKFEKSLDDFEKNFNSKKQETITDLQTYIIVNDRIDEARGNVEVANEFLGENKTKEASLILATAVERLNSAKSWSRFFGTGTKKLVLDKEALKEVCLEKVSEAQERQQYVAMYFPKNAAQISDDVEIAQELFNKEKFELCIEKASTAKADADVILSSLSVEKENLGFLVKQKLAAAQESIARQNAKGMFPIMGYSYYELASNLQKEDEVSALIYSEYALELSSLDMYFKTKESVSDVNKRVIISNRELIYLGLGLILGLLIAELYYTIRKISLKKKIIRKK